jgi:hypothetical protein
MARIPEDVKAQDGATPKAPAVDNGRIDKDVPADEKAHPKVHKSQDEEPSQDTTDQPFVEDEP